MGYKDEKPISRTDNVIIMTASEFKESNRLAYERGLADGRMRVPLETPATKPVTSAKASATKPKGKKK